MYFNFLRPAFAMIEGEPGVIIGPISTVFGAVINVIFNVMSHITPVGVLGLSIIVMTLLIRTLMLPIHVKMHRNSIKMNELKPELDKIKEKYKDAKDPELRRKQNVEIQAVYSKNNVNMFASCLPMLVIMPIFVALMFIMRQPFLFISSIGDVYSEISYTLINETYPSAQAFEAALEPLVRPRLPQGMSFRPHEVEYLNRAIAVFSYDDWVQLFNTIDDPTALANIQSLYNNKNSIESFLGISMVLNPGFAFPGILIPILSALTSFLSTYTMSLRNKNQNQTMPGGKVMLYVMPLVMGWFTISIAAGVGLYWTIGNVYQIGQQYVMNKRYKAKLG